MDIDENDSIDIGIDEKLNEGMTCVSLTNAVIPVTQQEVSMLNEDFLNTEPKEGDCHIFNYQKFDAKTLSPRKGSEKDAIRLKHDFSQLNLEVYQHDDLTWEETFRVLREASTKDYSKSKYFVCCFLTHGAKNGVLWAKDCRMYIDRLLTVFAKSSSLKGIPKIFIIEACRGAEAELAVSIDSTDSGLSTDIEVFSDILVVYSTYPDKLSFKTSNEEEEKCCGSFFVDDFCRSLEEFSSRLDLIQILTIVNWRMAYLFLSHCKDKDKKTELDEKKQMPCFYSTLKEKVEFNRNIEPFLPTFAKTFDKRRKRHGSGHLDILVTDDPRLNRYCIKKAERVLFLSIVDENIFKNNPLLQSAINLTTDINYKNYSHETFQGNFKKSKILKFLEKNSNLSGKRNESKAKKSSDVDCLICYIAACSRYDYVCDADGRKITKEDIVEKFVGQLNKSFVGKPKIFIFLLCKFNDEEKLPGERSFEDVERGQFMQFPISDPYIRTCGRCFNDGSDTTDGETDQNSNSTDKELNTNTESTNSRYIGENLIPVHADILELCITIRDWNEAIGPINLFREILKKSQSEDLLSLLTDFNRKLAENHDFFELSKFFYMTSTLTKTLFLP